MSSIYLVYRSHYKGPLSKSITVLPAETILEWFQWAWTAAKNADDPRDFIDDHLGVYLYGFSSLFEAAKEEDLPVPQSTEELLDALQKHLYVEGGPEYIRLDEHTLRVRTDDDEVELAYYFFDQAYASAHPDRVAYLLHDDPRLPDGAAIASEIEISPFSSPVPLKALGPKADSEGQVYACLFTFYDGESLIPPGPFVFEGLRLPDFMNYLRTVCPETKEAQTSWGYRYLDTWPIELRVLRGLIQPGDQTLVAPLERANRYPLNSIGQKSNSTIANGPLAEAHKELNDLLKDLQPSSGDPHKTLFFIGEHIAQMCMHTSSSFGYQQWFLFDDLWAAKYPSLAKNLLRYNHQWDILETP